MQVGGNRNGPSSRRWDPVEKKTGSQTQAKVPLHQYSKEYSASYGKYASGLKTRRVIHEVCSVYGNNDREDGGRVQSWN